MNICKVLFFLVWKYRKASKHNENKCIIQHVIIVVILKQL